MKIGIMLKQVVNTDSALSFTSRIVRAIASKIAPHVFAQKINFRWKFRRRVRPHGLPSQLIVSLTSYPARFDTLPLSLKCLLAQSMAPDRVILWIAKGDKKFLTSNIIKLVSDGLEIRFCEDHRSYKKIIPTLQEMPDAFIVTADDDSYYWPTWLEELVGEYAGDDHVALCHRMHRIRLNSDGFPVPYDDWVYEVSDQKLSVLNFPTSGGGVFYPPGVFHPSALKIDAIARLCPYADDIWLYWMMRMNGGVALKVGKRHRLTEWPGTQEDALWQRNVTLCENDNQISLMIKEFGSCW